MINLEHTSTNPVEYSVPKVVSPRPIQYWDPFQTILQWREETRAHDCLDLNGSNQEGSWIDASSQELDVLRPETPEEHFLPALPLLWAKVRERDRRHEWSAYRKVVATDPSTTIAPPWPPFLPPARSPSPQLSDDSPQNSSPSPVAVQSTENSGPGSWKWWEYCTSPIVYTDPGVIGRPAGTSEQLESMSPSLPVPAPVTSRARSGTTGTTTSVTTLTTPSECGKSIAREECVLTPAVVMPSFKVNFAEESRPTAAEELRLIAARESLPTAEAFFDDDVLTDCEVYDNDMEQLILERAAVARELKWMMMGVLPMG